MPDLAASAARQGCRRPARFPDVRPPRRQKDERLPQAAGSKMLASKICMATATMTNSFVQRFLGALALDTGIYEEVEQDAGATTQAFVMVVLASAAAGIGARTYVGGSPANVLFI